MAKVQELNSIAAGHTQDKGGTLRMALRASCIYLMESGAIKSNL